MNAVQVGASAVIVAVAAVAAWSLGVFDSTAVQAAAPTATFPWSATPTESTEDAPPPPVFVPTTKVAATAVPAATAGTVELCGVGRVSLPAEAMARAAEHGVEGLPAPIGRLALAQAREQMLASLRAQGTSRAATAALLLQRPETAEPQAQRAWAEQVVRLALSRFDVIALAWAEEACGYLDDGAACRMALIRARVAAEPDNAHHWAALADEDPASADEAWRGILQARRWHEAPSALLVTAQQALGHGTPAYIRAALGAELVTRGGTLPTPGEGFLQERCAEAPADRRQQCGAVARLLVEHGDGTHSLAQGLRVASAAGWTDEQRSVISTALDRRGRQESAWRKDAEQPLSCTGFEPWQRHIDELSSTLAPAR